MPFDWTNYLRLAEDLAARGDDAALRSAISRAYYFIFNVAYGRAVNNLGPKPDNKAFHAWCWDSYRNCADQTCQKLGIEGDRLKWKRVRVDYNNTDIHRLDQECQRMLLDVQAFSARLASLNARFPTP
jgi:hypothetical protein